MEQFDFDDIGARAFALMLKAFLIRYFTGWLAAMIAP
jgi:hypothetical protein